MKLFNKNLLIKKYHSFIAIFIPTFISLINKTFQTLSSLFLKDPSFQPTFSTPSHWNIFPTIQHLFPITQDCSTFWTSFLYLPLTIAHEYDTTCARKLIKVTQTVSMSLEKVCYSLSAWQKLNICTKSL